MAQRLPEPDPNGAVSAEQVRALATGALDRHLPLAVAGYRYETADIFNVVVAAAAQGRSVESACRQLVDAPSANLVRHYLIERLFAREDADALEGRCNALLVDRLPPRLLERELRVAIDLTLLPYYGKTTFVDDQLRRGEAKAGTTRFHCYATAFALHAGRRVTLALTFVYAEEALPDILEDLLARLHRLGVRVKELYLDREFAAVAILRLLQGQPFTSIVALPKRGKALKGLLEGRRGFRTAYTMRSAEEGELTFPLWVACRYAAGRRGRRGIDYLPFAVVGLRPCAMTVPRVAESYRARFGIESRYRQMHQVLAVTTSPDPAFRLLLVTVALLLTNLWVWLKAAIIAQTARAECQAARRRLETAFRLDQFRDLLIEALKALYRVNSSLACPFASPLKL
jgi:hypothetical protein